MSHLARGAWIETIGAGGFIRIVSSHLARGAWIETRHRSGHTGAECRTSQGVRGLKPYGQLVNPAVFGRTSQGVRGLKLALCPPTYHKCIVAPRKGCVD